MPTQDWFTQNAPSASPSTPAPATSGDWFASNAPQSSQPDTRSLWQKAKDNFNANTQGAKPGDGAIKSFVEDVGAGGGDVVRAIAHPIDTIGKMASTPDPMLQYFAGDRQKVLDESKNAPDLARTIGQVGTGAIVAGAAPVVARAAGNAAIDAIDGTAAAAKRLYPTSQSLAANVSAARNLAKALVIDPAGVNNFVKSATDEAGTVLGYAKENGLPINSKVDFANAAKQTADAVQAHFDNNVLGPNADTTVSVPRDYRGVRLNTEGPRATLGAIQKRIDAINAELNPDYRKALPSQTSAALVSEADLVAEKQGLNNLLRNKLSDLTGIDPDDIAAVQQKAGKLRTIANEAQASANRDLTAAGKQAMGTTTSAVGTKAGIIDRGLQTIQGGPEIIGNRAVNKALRDVSPTELVLPNPRTKPVGAGAAYKLWKETTGK